MSPLIPLYIARPFCFRGFEGGAASGLLLLLFMGGEKTHVNQVHAWRR